MPVGPGHPKGMGQGFKKINMEARRLQVMESERAAVLQNLYY